MAPRIASGRRLQQHYAFLHPIGADFDRSSLFMPFGALSSQIEVRQSVRFFRLRSHIELNCPLAASRRSQRHLFLLSNHGSSPPLLRLIENRYLRAPVPFFPSRVFFFNLNPFFTGRPSR